MEQPRVGILAYGSLIDDLGPDLTPFKVRPPVKTTTPFPVKTTTPFCVEFARSSRSRDDAPTLVPVENGRRVAAVIHEVKTTITDATNFLYWRERHLPQGSPQRRPYRQPNPVTVNSILIEQWRTQYENSFRGYGVQHSPDGRVMHEHIDKLLYVEMINFDTLYPNVFENSFIIRANVPSCNSINANFTKGRRHGRNLNHTRLNEC